MAEDDIPPPSLNSSYEAEDDPELLRRLAKYDPDLQKAAFDRWKERNRYAGDPGAPERWSFEQCGRCRYFIPLDGPMGADWGACSNPDSSFDRQVMFEHDGCEAFVDSGLDWVV